MPFFKDRALGVSEGRTYDIPLDKGNGRFFLTLLIALMVFLAMLSITAAYVLTQIADRWQTGLEGKWTIEIPAVDNSGNLIPRAQLKQQAQQLISELETFHAISDVEIMGDDTMISLLEPWFEFDKEMAQQMELPIPVLISLSVQSTSTQTAKGIQDVITQYNSEARLDLHQEWLSNLLRITGSLRLISVFFTFVILAAAVTAIAGAIQSRMAEHKDNVQLLHLMGASDWYIMKQFQRHGLIIAMQGGIIGLFTAICLLKAIIYYLSQTQEYGLPSVDFSPVFWIGIFIIPCTAAFLAAFTTRFTVLHTLGRMP